MTVLFAVPVQLAAFVAEFLFSCKHQYLTGSSVFLYSRMKWPRDVSGLALTVSRSGKQSCMVQVNCALTAGASRVIEVHSIAFLVPERSGEIQG